MHSNQETKVCPLCAESIKAAARVCPFCRAPQPGFGHWRPFFGVILSALGLLTVVILACVLALPNGLNSEGRSYAPHRADLVVEQTSLEHDAKDPEFWLSGYITNTGDYPWRIHELEVRFMSREGRLVDVRRAEVLKRFIVLPRQERAFRVGLGMLIFTNSDISETVRVQTATDADRPDKTD